MAWHHLSDDTTSAPIHTLKKWVDRRGYERDCVGREPTGENVSKTHSVWRCGGCRALAVTSQGERPSGKCGKCGAPG